MLSFSVTREAPPQPSPKGRETAYTGKKTTEHFLSHLKMLTLASYSFSANNSRGDFQSPETEEMKKAVLRAIANRPYKQ